MINPVNIIKNKREGKVLTKDEIYSFIECFLQGEIPDYQMSAFLMTVYFNGLNDEEIYDLTNIYINSGKVIDLSFLKIPKIDKHSTGGVGDKTSIILAPLLASLGIAVPMMSGRGLGHTGGTLDKLQSIPGFRIDLNEKEFKDILSKTNVCMIGQTDELAQADKKIYALRDVTATVECIGLIVPSIVSKKIAEGTEGIVYDVKTGTGSTLNEFARSKELADKLLNVTRKFGRKASVVLTDMNEPLGYAVGNAIEIKECVDIMRNDNDERSSDIKDLTLELASQMLSISGKFENKDNKSKAEENLKNGKCYDKFLEMVKAQGGDIEFIKENKIPETKFKYQLKSDESGYICELNAFYFGQVSVNLGCGRINKDSLIDHNAGIIFYKKVGDSVEKGDTICEFRYNSSQINNDFSDLRNIAYKISKDKIERKNKIIELID